MKRLYESILDNTDKVIDKVSAQFAGSKYKDIFPGYSNTIWDGEKRTLTSDLNIDIDEYRGVPSIYTYPDGGYNMAKLVPLKDILDDDIKVNVGRVRLSDNVIAKTNFKLSDISMITAEDLIFEPGDIIGRSVVTAAAIDSIINCKPNFQAIILQQYSMHTTDILKLNSMKDFKRVFYDVGIYDSVLPNILDLSGIKVNQLFIGNADKAFKYKQRRILISTILSKFTISQPPLKTSMDYPDYEWFLRIVNFIKNNPNTKLMFFNDFTCYYSYVTIEKDKLKFRKISDKKYIK